MCETWRRYAHGINMLPFTPLTSLLLPRAFVANEMPTLLESMRRRGMMPPGLEPWGTDPDVACTTAETASTSNSSVPRSSREDAQKIDTAALLPPVQSQWAGFIYQVRRVIDQKTPTREKALLLTSPCDAIH